MGLFDNVLNFDIEDPTGLQDKLNGLGINLDNLSIEVVDKQSVIKGSVESQADLDKLNATFAEQNLAIVDVKVAKAVENVVEENIRTYTVQDGDSPWSVAEKFWGDGNKYPILVEINQGKDSFFTGDVLQVPELRQYIGGKKLQIILKELGHNPGAIDGIVGPNTKKALKNFQEASGINADGELDNETKTALRKAFHTQVSNLDGIALQFILDELGYKPGVIDGVVGQNTKKAINAFQEKIGLAVDGTANAETCQQLAQQFV